MKAIIALLISLALMVVPALAFTPTIPTSTIEDLTDEQSMDYGTYSFERIVIDEDQQFSKQNAYSGVVFGSEENPWPVAIAQGAGQIPYTAGVVANKVDTNAQIWVPDTYKQAVDANGNPVYDANGKPVMVLDVAGHYTDGVNSEITRQYLQQGGTAQITLKESGIVYDPENPITPKPTVDIKFTKTNLAWVSGDMDVYEVSPQSYAAVGGNFIDEVPYELSPDCQNAWLIEREKQLPITIEATGESRLLEAYAGTKSSAELVLTPSAPATSSSGAVAATAKMSGYAERFAGYDDAWVDAKAQVTGSIATPGLDTNGIVINFGNAATGGNDNTVEHFWTSETGVVFDTPEYTDFPSTVGPLGTGPFGEVTWP